MFFLSFRDETSNFRKMGDLRLSGSIIIYFYERAENHKAKERLFESFK